VAITSEALHDMGARRPVRGSVAFAVVASVMVMATGRAEPAEAVTPPTVMAQLVQTIPTSGFNPPSPDPSGIVYLPPSGSRSGRFEIADSEVDETTGAGYHGVNLWQITPKGTVLDTGTTLPFSKEPTGLGYGPDGGAVALFISDDDKRKIFVDKAGNDGRYGTSDDVLTSVDTGALGSADTEDPEYDPLTGHLFFLSGAGTEIYDIDPVDGVFGNGNDTTTHFDISQYANDFEGLSSDPSRGTLLLGARASDRIFEITKTGALVQTIDLSQIPNLSHVSGLALGPASDGSGRNDLWIVDRKVDNGSNPTENDGLLFEVKTPVSDAPPTVTLTSPSQGATVRGSVPLAATASDDHGVSVVDFSVDGASVGSDTDAAGGFTSTWDSTSVPDGSHTITATATDTIGQRSSDSRSVTVDNLDSPPTVTLTAPAAGAYVSGTIQLLATASDDEAVAGVEFFDGGTSLGAGTLSSGVWRLSWTPSEGTHTATATATDNIGQTGSDSHAFTVDDTVPTVSLTSPADGATAIGTVTVIAQPIDASPVASVRFLSDGSVIGTDTSSSGGWSIAWNTVTESNGSHALTAIATDAAGNIGSTTTAVNVTVANPLVLDIPIAGGTDDVEQKLSGGLNRSSTDLDMMTDGTTVQAAIGLRFTNVQLPSQATITSAYLTFFEDEAHSDPTALTFQGQRLANAPAFSAKSSVTSPARTSARATWNQVPAWTLPLRSPHQTPDLRSIVQEIIALQNWAPGNAIAFVVTGSGKRVATSYESGFPTVLHIEYAMPS
jgi:Bacterial Ig domain